MSYTPGQATADRIIGRTVGELGEHIAVAFAPTGGAQGYVLAVRTTDKLEYVVWALVPGPDRSVMVTAGRYFDAEHYRHADRMGTGTSGAYEAAHAWWLYCVGRGPDPRPAEHAAMGAEHVAWCAGPSVH